MWSDKTKGSLSELRKRHGKSFAMTILAAESNQCLFIPLIHLTGTGINRHRLRSFDDVDHALSNIAPEIYDTY